MGIMVVGQVEKANGKELGYHDFVRRFMEVNRPVLLTDLMDGWMACHDWLTPNGSPNLPFFSTHFGDSLVQVVRCGTKESTDQQRMEIPVSDFIEQWSDDSANEEDSSSLLYLKDWHFAKEYPKYAAYTTPLLFSDDWLNMYLDNYSIHEDPENPSESRGICCSDYRFVYMGRKGTWTPLHADVFRSYSWSANVSGKKRWLFLPPSQSHLVFDRNMKNSVYDIFEDIDQTRFPDFGKSVWLECIQEKDEVIFVPSGWYHQVHNLEDTISINHNWFNGHDLSWVWGLLLKDYKEAKHYIEDLRHECDDFEALCQRNLAANSGMNLRDFSLFMVRFCLAVLVLLFGSAPGPSLRRHLVRNLTSIRKTASEMELSGCFPSPEGERSVDVKATVHGPGFTGLVRDLSRVYRMIHGEDGADVAERASVSRFLEKFSGHRSGRVFSGEGISGEVISGGPAGLTLLVDECLVELS